MGNKRADFLNQITLWNFNKFGFSGIKSALNRFSTNAFKQWNDVSDVQNQSNISDGPNDINIACDNSEELLRVAIDNKTNQKLLALAKAANFMTLEKRCLVMKTYTFSKFNYFSSGMDVSQ